jgi:hypothetical protein
MSLQNVEALGYAVITDMRGSASDKAIHVLRIPAAERAGERRPEQAADPRQGRTTPQANHVLGSLSTIRPLKALWQQAVRRESGFILKVWWL